MTPQQTMLRDEAKNDGWWISLLAHNLSVVTRWGTKISDADYAALYRANQDDAKRTALRQYRTRLREMRRGRTGIGP